jgi:DNA-binding LacI/PurR family transcriptional regulator
LISLGHQRIGYLHQVLPSGETRHFSSEDREQGYLEAIKDAGLPPLLIKPAQSGAALLRVSIRDALLGQNSHEGAPVTGFVTGSRGQAEILLLEAIHLGLGPGRDFSLIAVDTVTDPVGDIQIDFLRTPAYWLGRAASQLALDLLKQGKATLPSRVVPYHDYIEGHTCGPAGQ